MIKQSVNAERSRVLAFVEMQETAEETGNKQAAVVDVDVHSSRDSAVSEEPGGGGDVEGGSAAGTDSIENESAAV